MAKGQLRSNKEKKKPKQQKKPVAPVSTWTAPANPWKKPDPQQS
ncbi:MAG: hypothetical protein ACREVG_04005 [Burkholderiales bacterium]